MDEKKVWNQIVCLFEEMIEMQKNKLMAQAKRITPHITEDDLMQPNDFPSLENHPEFRYEEGVLAGLEAVKMAVKALQKTKT